jgi:hypothetical protein
MMVCGELTIILYGTGKSISAKKLRDKSGELSVKVNQLLMAVTQLSTLNSYLST